MRRIDRIFHFIETRPSSDKLIFKLLALAFLVSLILVIVATSRGYMTLIPERGGSVIEGVVGTPRFINPVLAVTAADRDMVMLLYGGLMRLGGDGVLVPDIAESLTISEDGLTYNVILRSDVTFHDNTPVTADDVIFTIERIQDPALKSPLRANWEGVTLERIGEHELNFILAQPYAPFVENLTVGILPRHIWAMASNEELPFSQNNSEPVGSGPYETLRINRNRSGIPESYELAPYRNYHKNEPRIENLTIRFFPNEGALVEALKEGSVGSAASLSHPALEDVLSSSNARSTHELYRTPLPRTFAVFFNQNEAPLFRDIAVRRALDAAIDRDRLVVEALGGFGQALKGPVPPGFGIGTTTEAAAVSTATTSAIATSRVETAKEILRKGGWKVNQETLLWEKKIGEETVPLSFSLSTANTPSFEVTADLLTQMWSEVGVEIETKKFEQGDLTQAIIRPRKYDALLFGTAVGRELDFYSFWHSSQRNDPGLNIALYANITTDSALEEMRAGGTPLERADAYQRFVSEMQKDLPALFLYVPEFTYLALKTTHDVTLRGVAAPSERFSTIEAWYAESESVWPFFTP